jgi:carotenoid cleavage dioxygenase
MTSSPGTSAIAPEIKVRTKERTEAHPHPYLRDNFYPVFEETVGDDGIECQVIGTIPESLRGSQYVRTGPNSLNVPKDGAHHHFFDGEGTRVFMLVMLYDVYHWITDCCLFDV